MHADGISTLTSVSNGIRERSIMDHYDPMFSSTLGGYQEQNWGIMSSPGVFSMLGWYLKYTVCVCMWEGGGGGGGL